ncbi:MAG: PadR family transcriptional regulator [Gemmatimonadota bacterium]|nr:PadR family transcriptional regulator [Gemmatimonadota bacterium]
MPETEPHILRESVDLLILKALAWGPKHGYAISDWIVTATRAELFIEEGTLYPALHRLARRRLVKTEWGASENNRRAKYYDLSPAGRARLIAHSSTWHRHVDAIAHALALPAPNVGR